MIDRVNSFLRACPTWPVYGLGAAAIGWYFWLGLTGGLGPEPIKALEHEYGQLALKVLIASLAVTPLRRFTGLNLMKFRRALGLVAFFLVLAHLAVWLFLDLRSWTLIWKDILKRPYITIGMTAFVLLVPLALTSNRYSIRRLGRRWNKLHRLVYPAVILSAVHFVMLVKGWQPEPLAYLAGVLVLLGLRLIPRRKRVAVSARTPV